MSQAVVRGLGARSAVVGMFGVGLGFSLSRIGFTDYGEVHAMFTLRDPRLVLVFAGAVALTALGMWALRGRGALPRLSVHKGSVVGGALFGAGWALTGACPGVVVAQIGEGKVLALLTLVGVLAGTALHRVVQARWLRWERPVTCSPGT